MGSQNDNICQTTYDQRARRSRDAGSMRRRRRGHPAGRATGARGDHFRGHHRERRPVLRFPRFRRIRHPDRSRGARSASCGRRVPFRLRGRAREVPLLRNHVRAFERLLLRARRPWNSPLRGRWNAHGRRPHRPGHALGRGNGSKPGARIRSRPGAAADGARYRRCRLRRHGPTGDRHVRQSAGRGGRHRGHAGGERRRHVPSSHQERQQRDDADDRGHDVAAGRPARAGRVGGAQRAESSLHGRRGGPRGRSRGARRRRHRRRAGRSTGGQHRPDQPDRTWCLCGSHRRGRPLRGWSVGE